MPVPFSPLPSLPPSCTTATSSWVVKLAVGGHKLDVIAKDGAYVQRASVPHILLGPGERYDFLLKADQRAANYWIDVSTLSGDNSPAVLSYAGAPSASKDASLGAPRLSLGCQLSSKNFNAASLKPFRSVPAPPAQAKKQLALYLVNSADATMATPKAYLGTSSVKGMNAKVQPYKGCPDVTVGGKKVASKYCWALNWVPFQPPKGDVPMLLLKGSTAALQPRTYYEALELGSVVDVAFVNPGMMAHPMHLHGHHFWVLGAGSGGILDAKGAIRYSKLNAKTPIMADTFLVPAASMGSMSGRRRRRLLAQASMAGMQMPMMAPGYLVIRFKASNAGVWALHCHTHTHMATGMFMAMVVAKPGAKDPWLLPANATSCGL